MSRCDTLFCMSTQDEQRFQSLKEALAEIGPFRRGSVVHHYMRCGSPGCRCHADPPQLHGPYYDWTRKVRGKTVTVRVSEEQAQLLQHWIANARRLDEILREMKEVSARLTEPAFQAARKQKPAKPKRS